MDFITPEQFREIFRRASLQLNLTCDAAVIDNLVRIISLEYKEPLRPCHPRDILHQITWEARYRGEEPRVDCEAVAAACRNYFIKA